jgi:purine-binding chemotaxis protein CheW
MFSVHDRERAGIPSASAPRLPEVLVFRLSGSKLALPLAAIREVLPMPLLSRPPGLPSLAEGFLNLEGALIPVLRLDRLFRLGQFEPGLHTPLLIMQAPDICLGLPVDAVDGIAAVSDESLLPLRAEESFNGCMEAEVALNGRTVHLLNPGKILIEQERLRLLEFQETARQRLLELEGAL